METNTQPRNSLHPIWWGAGVAIILFSAVGTAAVLGWIPTSMGSARDNVALNAQSAAPPPAKARAPVPARAAAPAVQAEKDASLRTHIAYSRCPDCGVIESVTETDTKGQGSGLGAVGGAVVGGLVGNQVGAGRGKDVMTVVGAVGGALAGNEVEKRVKSTKSYVITIRFDDGSTRTISEASAPTWRAGDRVRIVDGVIRSNA
ncbi:MAG TPA: glycine zipper 2TM domain-containing protein [Burkholderiales bacterium]|nr:glycine zipper 2TM domain-containing protein [Burkholderiales bacterium]